MTVILSTDLRGWALSLHSPSAVHRSNSISQRGTLIHVWGPDFCGCCRGDAPWLPGFGGQRSLFSWVPWDCNNQRDISSQANTPITLQKQWTEMHPQSFCERGLFACPGALAWGAGFRFGSYQGAYGTALRECRTVDAIFVLSLCLTKACQYLP